ncbi:MAG: glycoside hydrolase family 3 C-terminal domain-containing protein [Lachnospiraceae bacterium]|nr:glycoside hydrolase family 3 C-terminal domain-containing protein [Lachnospiraceae bacterium]
MKNADQILSNLTLEEKASLLSARDFWHTKSYPEKDVSEVTVSDGPNGLRKSAFNPETGKEETVQAICFPTASCMASSFDPDLIKSVGEALGDECQSEDVHVLLGPGINMKRSPLCGRNFEYYSEDPYLAGELGVGFVDGVQSKGVGVSLKHFAANNQESRRFLISANMSKRTLHEIYLQAFETVVKRSKPWTLMCSYNRINGTYSSENKYLLTDTLRTRWGYDGLVMTDWGAMNEKTRSVGTGLDLEMPASNGVRDKELVEAVKAGTVSESDVDKAAKNVLNLMIKAEEGRKAYLSSQSKAPSYDKEEHHSIARRVAKESAVLLKNENNVLPLSRGNDGKTHSYAFIGGFVSQAKYQGGGSSHINSYRVDTVIDAAHSYNDVKIKFAQGYYIEPTDAEKGSRTEDELLDEAIGLATKSDVSIIFAGLPDSFESEGFDRSHMSMPDNQNKLISEIAKVSDKTVVVLFNGSPVTMPWINEVDSVLEMYLSGEAGGYATLDLLFGNVSPSGHLAETFPLRIEDTPCYLNFPGNLYDVDYNEGVFIGYRYYEKKNIPVLFPFGHGLTYTTFEYDNLRIEKGNTPFDCKVLVDLTNTGNFAAAEVAQLYVGNCICEDNRPVKELRGFKKVSLKPGETRTLEFELSKRSFAYFNELMDDWYVPSGEYIIQIGSSSKDIRCKETIEIESTDELKFEVNELTPPGDIIKYKKDITPLKEFLANTSFTEMYGIDLDGDVKSIKPTMASAMFFETPLHSVLSFNPRFKPEDGEPLTPEDVRKTIDKLNSVE